MSKVNAEITLFSAEIQNFLGVVKTSTNLASLPFYHAQTKTKKQKLFFDTLEIRKTCIRIKNRGYQKKKDNFLLSSPIKRKGHKARYRQRLLQRKRTGGL